MSTATASGQTKHRQLSATTPDETEDLDPLVDIAVTVTIKEIRAFDKIDLFTDPDFYVKVFINGKEYESPIWHNMKYVEDIAWSATCNVPDGEEWVDVKIQLWDWNFGKDKLCDISRNDQTDKAINNSDIELYYNIITGRWWGEDYAFDDPMDPDLSGYGRLNGCDDNSIYQNDRDC